MAKKSNPTKILLESAIALLTTLALPPMAQGAPSDQDLARQINNPSVFQVVGGKASTLNPSQEGRTQSGDILMVGTDSLQIKQETNSRTPFWRVTSTTYQDQLQQAMFTTSTLNEQGLRSHTQCLGSLKIETKINDGKKERTVLDRGPIQCLTATKKHCEKFLKYFSRKPLQMHSPNKIAELGQQCSQLGEWIKNATLAEPYPVQNYPAALTDESIAKEDLSAISNVLKPQEVYATKKLGPIKLMHEFLAPTLTPESTQNTTRALQARATNIGSATEDLILMTQFTQSCLTAKFVDSSGSVGGPPTQTQGAK